ncbi:hypothetical protein GCM10022243_23760 [Saccharothrix violaceirubra]|uniref:Sigma-70-like protein n=1 Tax=Saccharothrix violaceirubra TaxID=413306 RepID=A0A7W7T779_9PSEU|nr:hypothetical protein [Saccharothrix violaceirubra]MBB4967821.1 hypothetical protein [Saccharothrix violaceirubra]
MADDFDSLREDPDPVRRGKRATDLLAVYQQRSAELARLRRAAIEEARDLLGGSYTEVAKAFGLTKGRITQIRSSAPPEHRAFFGVGPLDLALPGRLIRERDALLIASEDDAAGLQLSAQADKLAFIVNRVVLDPREEWEPAGDAIVVCGPTSAHIGHRLMGDDPCLRMAIGDNGQWHIVDQDTGQWYLSPLDEEAPVRADHAYIARHRWGSRVIVHIAGLHALGSIGAAHYITNAAADLFADFGDTEFSMAVTTEFDGLVPKAPKVLVPPRAWA